ncbi:MAG: DNA polymerase III subunit gamma/tau [Deltaproteobacteria bacterium]
MSYVVLARKWRPQQFSDVLGQEHVTQTLTNAIASDRIAHAFLFSGPRGVGKTSAARILAKALCCEAQDGPTATPCGVCQQCQQITDGRSTDVFEIDAASHTGVDNVREIIDNVRYLPSAARYKIYVVDEVHMLSTGAFNALLKTLEEPPAHVKFVLATTDVHKVPVTILSRCQRYDFRRIALSRIAERLSFILSEEGIEHDPSALTLVAREAEGSMRDAQSLLEQVLAFAGQRRLDGPLVRDALGVVDAALVGRAVDAILGREPGAAIEIVSDVHERGLDLSRFADALVEHVRDLLVARLVPTPSNVLDRPSDEIDALVDRAKTVPAPELERVFEHLCKAVEEVGRASHPRFVLEVQLASIAEAPARVPVEALLEELRNVQARLDGGAPPRGGSGGGGGGRGGRGGYERFERGRQRADDGREVGGGGARFDGRGAPGADRGGQRGDDRGPGRPEDRGPGRPDERGGDRAHDRGDRGPTRHDDHGPGNRGDQPADDRGPSRHDDRGPGHRGGQPADDRGPSRHDGRGASRHDDRQDQRVDDHGSSRPNARGHGDGANDRGDVRGPSAPDERGRQRVDDHGSSRPDARGHGDGAHDRGDARGASDPDDRWRERGSSRSEDRGPHRADDRSAHRADDHGPPPGYDEPPHPAGDDDRGPPPGYDEPPHPAGRSGYNGANGHASPDALAATVPARFKAFVDLVKKKRPPLAATLVQVRPLTFEKGRVELGCETRFDLHKLEDADTKKTLEGYLAEYFGAPTRIEVRHSKGGGAPSQERPATLDEVHEAGRQATRREKERVAKSHPAVKAIEGELGGEIAKVRVLDEG